MRTNTACPQCNSWRVEISLERGDVALRCQDCGFTGPGGEGRYETAVGKWNFVADRIRERKR